MTQGGAGARSVWLLHGLAASAAVVGVLAQFSGPALPDIGSLPVPETVFETEYITRAAAFRRPVYVAATVAVVLRIAVAALVACTPPGRRLTAAVVQRVGTGRPARAAAAVVLAMVIATDLALWPLQFWIGFVHEGTYGLRTQGLGGWLYDWIVVHGPVWLGAGAAGLGGFTLARRFPRAWAPVGGLVVGVVTAVVVFVSPVLFEPLMYRFTPLEPGPVRTEVERVLQRSGESVDRIYVADASRRSSRENAYVSGFGASERVVLFDTLLDRRSPAEIGLVLAHEVAHKRNGDVVRYTLLTVAGAIAAAYVLKAVVRRRARRGWQNEDADPHGAAIIVLTVVVLSALAVPVQSWVSRRTEAAADLGSLDFTATPDVFVEMHRGLAESNLLEPLPPGPVTWYWGSHPPTMARIAMARWWERR